MPSAAAVGVARHLAAVTALNRRERLTADTAVVAEFAQGLDEGALACRDVGHAWRSRKVIRRRWGFERVMVCRDCHAERREDLDRMARRVKAYAVQYPDGYLLPKGSGRLDADGKAAMRLELLTRGA